MGRAKYSRWDGTQDSGDLSGDDIMRRLMDDLVEHGDPNQALRRLLQRGFTDALGRQVAGLRELLERVRRRRSERAREAFSEAQAALANASPEALRQAREMLRALNNLIERRQAGHDIAPEFRQFMDRWGDFVPGHPQDLDELLGNIRRQMAAARALLEALSPEQRAKLAELSEALLDADRGMAAELERLAAHVAGAAEPLDFAFGLGPVSGTTGELDDLAQLEQLLAAAPNPGALAEVDLDRVRQLLGADEARSLEALSQIARRLSDAGLVEQKEGKLQLTPSGLRRIAGQALSDLYSRLARYRSGQHSVAHPGPGHERAGETKPYEWGDAFNLSIERTVRNALARQGPGAPLHLCPEDFEVERTEAVSRAATVIMLDLSLSMGIRGNFVAAKKMTLALYALISGRFPSDYLGLVGFSRSARAITFAELPEVSWGLDWGTNIQHGLSLSRQLLARQRGTKQVIMVTDGEPTAHWPAGAAEPVFAYPPTRETVDATLVEVARCTRERICINTFALDATGHLRRFVEQLARLNQGRAFFTSPEELGDYVLVDFLENRRSLRRQGRRPA